MQYSIETLRDHEERLSKLRLELRELLRVNDTIAPNWDFLSKERQLVHDINNEQMIIRVIETKRNKVK